MVKGLAATGVFVCATAVVHVSAQGPTAAGITREEFEAKLGYQTGTVSISGGMARIHLPPTFRFIAEEGSRRLLTDAWGNPAESAESVLGMLIPTSVSPLSEEGWGVVITYEEDGYVDDKDAGSINFTKLLREMKEETADANKERQNDGFEPITLVGWAEPPHYDAATHKLYWAKELAFGDDPKHTLNYNIRILGRRGVLVLNAVAGMDKLAAVRSQSPDILAAVEFNEGHRYTDYLPGRDKAATYGVAGLIVGATAAKAGFFKMLWVGILAFKKVLIAALVALGAVAKRFFSGKPASEAPESGERSSESV